MSESSAPASAPVTPTAAPAASADPTATNVVSAELETADAVEVEGANDAIDGDGKAADPKAKAKVEKAKEASRKKKYQLKVDGQEEEYELDLDDDEAIKTELQMAKVARKRMQETSDYKKNLAAFFEKLQTNPLEVLMDPRLQIPDEVRKQMAEKIINNEIEELQKTPEQREKDKIQRELDTLRKQIEEDKQRSEQAELSRYQEQAAQQFDSDISSAIKENNLPQTAETVREVAQILLLCMDNNIELSAKDVVPYLKQRKLASLKEQFSQLSDDQFEEWIGKDNISRIRKRQLAKMKAPVPETAADIKPTVEGSKKKTSETVDKKVSLKDFMNSLGKF